MMNNILIAASSSILLHIPYNKEISNEDIGRKHRHNS